MEKNFQPNVYEDFEKLTFEFYLNGDLYGLEKYWYVLSFYLFAFLFCEIVAGDYLFIFSEGIYCCSNSTITCELTVIVSPYE